VTQSLVRADLRDVLAAVADRMPDPADTREVERLEERLAAWADVPYAVAVSSGTAALHTALVAAGIGRGDRVLVPAVSVVMSVAPILHAGATPVFVDCVPGGFELDYADLSAKLVRQPKAILPVHLWGRACGDPYYLHAFAKDHGVTVIEDACQAHGTRIDDGLLGTFGDVGCFSLKDGKILSSGEGGFLLTRDEGIAARARAFRTHWQTPPEGDAPLTRLGHNYRLAEPLAAVAGWNLARIGELLNRRRQQTSLLTKLLADAPGMTPISSPADEDWNGYSPLIRLALPESRRFCERLTTIGVPNSVGTHRLVAAHLRPVFNSAERCPRAEATIDNMLAITLTEHDDDDRIRQLAAAIRREAHLWTSR
jgi:perosamine synthetase